MTMEIRNRLRRQDGAAAVEFALIVSVLVMLLFGMLQFGLAFFQLQNLRAAAREGARIGAVEADVTAVKSRVQEASNNAIDSSSGALQVLYTSDGTNWNTVASGRACPPKNQQTTNSAVRVQIDLASSSLSPGLQDIFTVNIPLMPPISLRNAPVSGDFRCEGN
jgi:Flp pilus assembly protein TadG